MLLLLYVTGLIGVLILFMWFATDHTVCKNNLNIAWALPTNFIAAFCILKKPTWLSTYFFIAAVITGLLLAILVLVATTNEYCFITSNIIFA